MRDWFMRLVNSSAGLLLFGNRNLWNPAIADPQCRFPVDWPVHDDPPGWAHMRTNFFDQDEHLQVHETWNELRKAQLL
jgi:hypothetical protein